MQILSWNINGIRSLKTPVRQILSQLNGDIICFQETKISRNQIDEGIAFIKDYFSFFAVPRYQSGYSGVATYCSSRVKPFQAQDGFYCYDNNFLEAFESQLFTESKIKELDQEGRLIITQHSFKANEEDVRNLFIFNVYCPRNDPDRPERALYKLNFHRLLEEIARYLLNCDPSNHVLIIGDINISPKRIDHCDPDDDFEESPYRQWLDELLSPSSSPDKQKHFIDIFRHRHPTAKNAFTCWNTKLAARKTNYGTRIDLALCDVNLYKYVTDFEILTHIEGSDHCPIRVVFGNIIPISSQIVPKLCTTFWPELGEGKRQISIKGFLQKQAPSASIIQESVSITKQTKKVKQESIKKYFKTNESSRCPRVEVNEETSQESSKSSSSQKLFDEIVNKELLFAQEVFNQTTSYDERKDNEAAAAWRKLLPGLTKIPVCTFHKEPCVLLTVNKAGPNKGRKFYACARPTGRKNDPASSCEFFLWYKV